MPVVTLYVKGPNWFMARVVAPQKSDWMYNKGVTHDQPIAEMRLIHMQVPKHETRPLLRQTIEDINDRRQKPGP